MVPSSKNTPTSNKFQEDSKVKGSSPKKEQDIKFQETLKLVMENARDQIKVDLIPSLKTVEKLSMLLEPELEEAVA